MNLTNKDIALIAEAEQALSRARTVTISMIVVLVILLAVFIYGWLDAVIFASMCVGLSLLAILLPQLGGSKQSEIVRLLVRIRNEATMPQKDPIIDALTKTSAGS